MSVHMISFGAVITFLFGRIFILSDEKGRKENGEWNKEDGKIVKVENVNGNSLRLCVSAVKYFAWQYPKSQIPNQKSQINYKYLINFAQNSSSDRHN